MLPLTKQVFRFIHKNVYDVQMQYNWDNEILKIVFCISCMTITSCLRSIFCPFQFNIERVNYIIHKIYPLFSL